MNAGQGKERRKWRDAGRAGTGAASCSTAVWPFLERGHSATRPASCSRSIGATMAPTGTEFPLHRFMTASLLGLSAPRWKNVPARKIASQLRAQ